MKKIVIKVISYCLILSISSCNINNDEGDFTEIKRTMPEPLNSKELDLIKKIDSIGYRISIRKYSISAHKKNKEQIPYDLLFHMKVNPHIKKGDNCEDFLNLIKDICCELYAKAMDDSMAYEIKEIRVNILSDFIPTKTPCNIPRVIDKKLLEEETGLKIFKSNEGFEWIYI